MNSIWRTHRCFQVFKIIHQLVDAEEDILMVRLGLTKTNLKSYERILRNDKHLVNVLRTLPSNKLH